MAVGASAKAGQRTLTGFVDQLRRATPSNARAEYLRNQPLFAGRPDVLARVVRTLPWDNALAVLGGAYFAHEIPVDAYSAAMRAVVRDSKGSSDGSARRPPSWRAAEALVTAAHEAHGNVVPASLYANAVRACAFQQAWEPALRLTKLAESRELSSKMLLLNASRATAVPHAWPSSLRLLATSGVFGSNDPRVTESSKIALLRSLSCAPWQVSLKIAKSKSVARILGQKSTRALIAATTPWSVALSLLPRTRTAEETAAALASAPGTAVVQYMNEVSDPRLAPLLLTKACEARDWRSALQVLAHDGQSAVGMTEFSQRSLASTILLTSAAGNHGATALVALQLAEARMQLPRKALIASLHSMVEVGTPWDTALRSFSALSEQHADETDLLQAVDPKKSLAKVMRAPRAPPVACLDHVALSLVVQLCSAQGQPDASLRAIATARSRNDLELDDSARLEALLFCQRYGRWREAALVFSRGEGHSVGQQRRLLPFLQRILQQTAAPHGLAEIAARSCPK